MSIKNDILVKGYEMVRSPVPIRPFQGSSCSEPELREIFEEDRGQILKEYNATFFKMLIRKYQKRSLLTEVGFLWIHQDFAFFSLSDS